MSRIEKMSPKGVLRSLLGFPILLTAFVAIAGGAMVILEEKIVQLAFLVLIIVYTIGMIVYFIIRRYRIMSDLMQYAENFDNMQKQQMQQLVLPYALLDINGRMLWGNNAFVEIIQNKKAAKRGICNLFPEITQDVLPKGVEDSEKLIEFEGRFYRVVLRLVSPNGFCETAGEEDEEQDTFVTEDCMIGCYLYDETKMVECMQKLEDEQIVMGLLYLDNYDEAMESISSVKRSLFVGLIDRRINKYMKNIDAIIKKTEKDKYFFVFRHKYLAQMKESKFSLVEDVRDVNIGNEMSMTISMGIGLNQEGYQKTYDYTRAALDLALGRGGDQIVVKENEKVSYYGGKNVQVEKGTRVKARVKAHALQELMSAKERVVIMGHAMSDADSIGASIGVYRVAKTLNKKANIVVNNPNENVQSVLERFCDNSEYENDFLITSEQAKQLVDHKSLVVVVDVNQPARTECPEILKQTGTIVVLDHHRQTGEKIENAVLSYIEPYASSACEMVAEILQYIEDGIKLRPIEADAMYAGIVIDTRQFSSKTGARTFEAAAFLRKNGADVSRIRKMLRVNMHDYETRANAINQLEIFMDCFAFTECKPGSSRIPTILGAQIANELLDIAGIKGSFVFTEYEGKIYISARSIDEINVQLVMERLGGGGHISEAGVQLTECTMDQAKRKVKQVLETMLEEGDL